MHASENPERIPCKHCNETGTCSTGVNGTACAVCAKRYPEAAMGLPCCICEGRGSVEPFSLKLYNRFLPFFAMGFVAILLIIVCVSVWSSGHKFDKVIGFAGTLIGSITGYYFGGKPIAASASAPKKHPSDNNPR
jgi:hypothetical protein